MLNQYFGLKELSQVTLRARTDMWFGSRRVEAGEPILYFENVSMSTLNERNSLVSARGGWENRPRVVWDSRDDVTFTLQEGVMSSVGMSILLSANAVSHCETAKEDDYLLLPHHEQLIIQKSMCTLRDYTENESEPEEYFNFIQLSHQPEIRLPQYKVFLLAFARDNIQVKLYGKFVTNAHDETETLLVLYNDKNLTSLLEDNYEYCVADYYYKYSKESRQGAEAPLVYTLSRDRFNGLFTLEGKFYSKDENDGKNYINLLYMPKVRILSDINLRLGEKANPTVSVFNILGLPVNETGKRDMILEITRLDQVEDEDF